MFSNPTVIPSTLPTTQAVISSFLPLSTPLPPVVFLILFSTPKLKTPWVVAVTERCECGRIGAAMAKRRNNNTSLTLFPLPSGPQPRPSKQAVPQTASLPRGLTRRLQMSSQLASFRPPCLPRCQIRAVTVRVME